ncbi:MAG TPA: hypothetical protein VFG00_05510, partial [Acidothermaceae bacterium]|nr:hypothetical protein [Acidothermaceae bacterium]
TTGGMSSAFTTKAPPPKRPGVGSLSRSVSCEHSELPLPASTDDGNEGYQTGSGPQDTTEQT